MGQGKGKLGHTHWWKHDRSVDHFGAKLLAKSAGVCPVTQTVRRKSSDQVMCMISPRAFGPTRRTIPSRRPDLTRGSNGRSKPLGVGLSWSSVKRGDEAGYGRGWRRERRMEEQNRTSALTKNTHHYPSVSSPL